MDGLRQDAEIMFVPTTNRPESLEAELAAAPDGSTRPSTSSSHADADPSHHDEQSLDLGGRAGDWACPPPLDRLSPPGPSAATRLVVPILFLESPPEYQRRPPSDFQRVREMPLLDATIPSL
jgi:hypothetical protein